MRDARLDRSRLESHCRQLFIQTATVIYILEQELHTLIAVPRSTPLTILGGMVNEYQLSHEK